MAQVLSPATSLENGDDSVPKRLNRSYVACKRCHDHKVKCSGETPKCRGCQQAKKPSECVYPLRDRKLSVPESYLRKLEAENRELKRKRSPNHVPYASPSAASTDSHHASVPISSTKSNLATNSEPHVEEDLSFENDETFIEPNYIGEAACTTFCSRIHQYFAGEDSQGPPRRPHYFRNQRLHRLTNPEYHLPEWDDAQVLVTAVLNFIGPDYHLLLKKSFLEKLEKTYREGRCDDHVWLCRLFVVFALGELYSQGASDTKGGRSVPGTSYFMKAMELFEDLYEEPTIEYIETLLVIAFYSTALNRIIPAYTYSGLALRLSLTLGLHRKIPDNRVMTSREREHRIRVWWTVYNLDRVCSSKVGLPIMLRDEDIDVPLPSMENLSDDEKEDFHDPQHIIAQHLLAKITGEILNEIYRIPQPGRAKTFPFRVRKVLTSLQSWQDNLPVILKFNKHKNPMYSSRSVASLHLNYSQCVILATRTIFFPCLRAHYEASRGNSNGPRPVSELVEGLSEACVNAARTSSSIIAQLRCNRDLATFGFFDALSIFSSTLILMMSSMMQYKSHEGDRGKVETSLKLLKTMRDDGNMPAHSYYDQLMQLKDDMDHAVENIHGSLTPTQGGGHQNNGLQMLLVASSPNIETEVHSAPRLLSTTSSFGSFGNYLPTDTILLDPYVQEFLKSQQQYPQYSTDTISSFPSDDFSWYFDDEFLDMSATGMF